MATVLVKEVIERVSRHLVDINPQFTHWTEREMVGYLNDAQRAIAKYMPTACPRIDAIKLKPGTRQSIDRILAADLVPTDGSQPAEVRGFQVMSVSRLMGTNGINPGRALRLIDRDVLDATQPDWHQSNSSSPSCYTFDPRTPKIFYVSPGVAAGGLSVFAEVSYLADPLPIPLLTAPASYNWDGAAFGVISIDDRFVDDLVSYMLARSYTKESEYAANANLASLHTSTFTASINAQVAAATGVNPNLTWLPFSPSVPAAAR